MNETSPPRRPRPGSNADTAPIPPLLPYSHQRETGGGRHRPHAGSVAASSITTRSITSDGPMLSVASTTVPVSRAAAKPSRRRTRVTASAAAVLVVAAIGSAATGLFVVSHNGKPGLVIGDEDRSLIGPNAKKVDRTTGPSDLRTPGTGVTGSHRHPRRSHRVGPPLGPSGRTTPAEHHHPDPTRQPSPTSDPGGSGGGGGGGGGSCVSNAKGIPSSGAYVGAAVGGTENVPDLEQHSGRLAIHRTYWEAGQVDSAVSLVRSDLAAGRLPWISFKMPYSWADMANGRGDSWAAALTDKLARVGGPVWLAFHHEPEGDGNMQDWKRMQQHLAPIVHARSNNIAYTIILISYDALFGPAEYHLDTVWPGDQYVDILGVDLYNSYGTNRNGNANIPMLDPMKYFGKFGPFARAHHVNWAVAETGYAPPAVKVDPDWLKKEYRDLLSEGGLALTYFDSSRNSIADWTLSEPGKMNAFNAILAQTERICSLT